MCSIPKRWHRSSEKCAMLNNGRTSPVRPGRGPNQTGVEAPPPVLKAAPLWDRGRVILASQEGAASAGKEWHGFDR
jgi:hypothetical protein